MFESAANETEKTGRRIEKVLLEKQFIFALVLRTLKHGERLSACA